MIPEKMRGRLHKFSSC